MTLPLISVCIPAYKAECWIGEAIESVLAQTWPRVETIVVDDGSPDGTFLAASRYAGPRVKVIRQDNRGPGAARNSAFREAQGDYIQFLDADDVLSPEKLGAAVELLDRLGDPNSVAICRWGRFRDSIADAEHHWEPSYRDQTGVDFLFDQHTKQPGGMQPIGTWVFPRRLVELAGPLPETLSFSSCEDGDLLDNVIMLGSTMLRFEPRGFLYYRSVPNSVSTRRTRSAVDARYRGAVKFERILTVEDSPRARYAVACAYKSFYMEFYTEPTAREFIPLAMERERELGGADSFEPSINWSPKFRRLRRLIGWRAALRLQGAYRGIRYATSASP